MATLSVGGNTVFDGATLQSGVTIASGTTFPAGLIRQIKFGDLGSLSTSSDSAFPNTVGFDVAKLASSDVLVHWQFHYIPRASPPKYGEAWLTGSNYGSGNSGKRISHYLGYSTDQIHNRIPVAGFLLDTNPTATPVYGVYIAGQSGSYEISSSEGPTGLTLFEILT